MLWSTLLTRNHPHINKLLTRVRPILMFRCHTVYPMTPRMMELICIDISDKHSKQTTENNRKYLSFFTHHLPHYSASANYIFLPQWMQYSAPIGISLPQSGQIPSSLTSVGTSIISSCFLPQWRQYVESTGIFAPQDTQTPSTAASSVTSIAPSSKRTGSSFFFLTTENEIRYERDNAEQKYSGSPPCTCPHRHVTFSAIIINEPCHTDSQQQCNRHKSASLQNDHFI